MIRPINKNVLVQCFEGDNISEGGIYVPDSVKKDSNKVKVIAVGEKAKELKAGDIGFRVKDWGQEIIDNGEKYYLMEESAIIALQ